MYLKLVTALVASSLLFTSCAKNFYQVLNVNPIDKIEKTDNALVYEDDNCKISYNLWAQNGSVSFTILNKTEKTLYLNMKESFFVLNGMAHNFYKNRVYTSSINTAGEMGHVLNIPVEYTTQNLKKVDGSASKWSSSSKSEGYSVSYSEEEIVGIPSKTVKIIKGYNVLNRYFNNCDLEKFPKTNKSNSIKYSLENSPITFGNILTYQIGDKRETLRNEFYVNEISNHREKDLIAKYYPVICNKKSLTTTEVFKSTSPSKFYIIYDNSATAK